MLKYYKVLNYQKQCDMNNNVMVMKKVNSSLITVCRDNNMIFVTTY